MKGFILTGDYEDQREHKLRFFGQSATGPFVLEFNNVSPLFFIAQSEGDQKIQGLKERKRLNLCSMASVPVDGLYFNTQQNLIEARENFASAGVRTYEADVRPVERFLMERFINCSIFVEGDKQTIAGVDTYINPKISKADYTPELSSLSFDIETSGGNELYSIAYHFKDKLKKIEFCKVLMMGEGNESTKIEEGEVDFYNHEKDLLIAFERELKKADPDLLFGWHVIGFDLSFLERKFEQHNLVFNLGRGKKKTRAIKKREEDGLRK